MNDDTSTGTFHGGSFEDLENDPELQIHDKQILTVRIKCHIKGTFDRVDHGKVADLIEQFEELAKEAFPDKKVEMRL